MDIDAEIGSYLVMREFEDTTWADAEKAKIHRMAEKAIEAFKKPVDPVRDRYDGLRNAQWGVLQNAQLQGMYQSFGQGQNFDPWLGNPLAAALGLCAAPCACCGR